MEDNSQKWELIQKEELWGKSTSVESILVYRSLRVLNLWNKNVINAPVRVKIINLESIIEHMSKSIVMNNMMLRITTMYFIFIQWFLFCNGYQSKYALVYCIWDWDRELLQW